MSSCPCLPNQPVCDALCQRMPKRWGRETDHFSESSFLWTLVLTHCCKETACIILWGVSSRRYLHFLPEFNLVKKQSKLAAPQWIAYLCCCSLNWNCLSVSMCHIDSLGTHLCPVMEQSSCAVTRIWRAARPYLLIRRLNNTTNKSSISGLPNVGHSHGPITGAGCYLKISVTENVFFFSQYYDTVKSGAAPELWKAGIWRNGLYRCLGKLEPSPEMTPSFLFAAEAN